MKDCLESKKPLIILYIDFKRKLYFIQKIVLVSLQNFDHDDFSSQRVHYIYWIQVALSSSCIWIWHVVYFARLIKNARNEWMIMHLWAIFIHFWNLNFYLPKNNFFKSDNKILSIFTLFMPLFEIMQIYQGFIFDILEISHPS